MSQINSISVFCSASERIKSKYLSLAYAFGNLLAENSVRLIYGGGRLGMMGQVADGCLAKNGDVYGITTDHLAEKEQAYKGLQKLDVVPDMHTRKIRMFDHSEAIVILPGGFGTLDEAIEVLTWRQIGLHDKPIVAVNYEGYWDKLQELIQHIVAENFAKESHKNLISFVTDINDVLPALYSSPQCEKPTHSNWI